MDPIGEDMDFLPSQTTQTRSFLSQDLDSSSSLSQSRNSNKQAKNGLQLRSSKNGKTAVWHYGLKLQ